MIAVDTSAIMAILLNEERADACMAVLAAEDDVVISAGTVAELLVVARQRRLADESARLLDEFGFIVIPVTARSAEQIADAYGRWGRGVHPAALNLGDCFSYAVAKEHDCPLLYVGEDFSKTDIASAG